MNDPGNLLRDISGLDAAPWWPPAPGWWLLLALAVLLIVGLWQAVRLVHYRRQRWRRDAERRLQALRRNLNGLPARQAASELSELLRRIAIVRCGRRQCAGLEGAEWLAWLHQHDPDGYDWREHGAVLLRLPYAPQESATDPGMLRPLVDAALNWVHADPIPAAALPPIPATGARQASV